MSGISTFVVYLGLFPVGCSWTGQEETLTGPVVVVPLGPFVSGGSPRVPLLTPLQYTLGPTPGPCPFLFVHLRILSSFSTPEANYYYVAIAKRLTLFAWYAEGESSYDLILRLFPPSTHILYTIETHDRNVNKTFRS